MPDHTSLKASQTAADSRAAGPAMAPGASAPQADQRPASVAQRRQQRLVDASKLVQRQQQQQARVASAALQRPAGKPAGAPIQRFALKNHTDYQGFLAGDDRIQRPSNVQAFIDMLRQNKPLPTDEPMMATPEMSWVPTPENADIFRPLTPEDDPKGPGVIKKRVLVNGHHRFVAHVEAGVALPTIAPKPEDYGETTDGLHWRAVGNIDYEPTPQEESKKAPAKAEEKKAHAKKPGRGTQKK